ncbi:winged helix-turn-helix domain-containing protein [Streptomyces populi]|uniref:winged helix-turn-helix domain-containing protein n=1 Tax=Streptomyces populi TaxID=2058924 RepID=UPI0013A6D0F8|nr:GntR family transcriptional regulator [Streptomyces populi]
MTASDTGTGPGGDESGGRPFQRVETALRLRLTDGTYRKGDMLPAQRTLEKDLGVSRDTVRNVLKLLAKEGWIATRRGSGTKVLKVPSAAAPQGRPQLYNFMHDAFKQPEVSLDVSALTGESFVGLFDLQVGRVEAGEISPLRVHVRMMLPSEDTELLYPRSGDPKDPRVHRRWRNMARLNAADMEDFCARLRDKGVKAGLEVHRVGWTPQFKLYILNDADALVGIYSPVRGPIRLEDGTSVPNAMDVKGVGLTLHHHQRPKEESARQSSYFADYREWFDTTWSELAKQPKSG